MDYLQLGVEKFEHEGIAMIHRFDMVDARGRALVRTQVGTWGFVWGEDQLGRCIGTATGTDGDRWPDILPYGPGGYPLVVTKRVLKPLREAGVGSFFTFPVELRIPHEHQSPPEYHAIFPEPIARVARRKKRDDGPYEPTVVYDVPPDCDTDLMTYDRGGERAKLVSSPSPILCTRRVVELARRHEWQGLIFEAVNTPGRDLHRVDHLSEEWPPEWRPPEPDELSPEEWFERAVRELPKARERNVYPGATALGILRHVPAVTRIAATELRHPDETRRTAAAYVVHAVSRWVRSKAVTADEAGMTEALRKEADLVRWGPDGPYA